MADELHPEERLRLGVVQLEEISQAAGNAAEAEEANNGGRAEEVVRGSGAPLITAVQVAHAQRAEHMQRDSPKAVPSWKQSG